jgi:salicylate hydroxylase
MKPDRRTVAVAGGGITGLAAALCLARAGFAVDLFEQAEGFDTIGAGLQISPNAASVLEQLGLLDRLKMAAVAPGAIRVMSGISGRDIARVSLGAMALERYGLPYLVAHRADLQQTLAMACADHPDIRLHMGCRVEDAATHDNGVTLLAKRGDRIVEQAARALIAADGVWSRLRATPFGLPKAVYSGQTAWRALISADQLPGVHDMENTQLWLAPRAHVLTYPVRTSRHLNVVVILDASEPPQGWATPGRVEEMRAALAGWNPLFMGLLDLQARWTRWPLFGQPDTPRWTLGNMALAGDAAHAMTPYAAQGAAMGLEDAWVLARCLAKARDEGSSTSEALLAYEKSRRDRVERAARLARTNKAIYHLPQPAAFARDAGMYLLGGERLLARQDWLYSWRAEENA